MEKCYVLQGIYVMSRIFVVPNPKPTFVYIIYLSFFNYLKWFGRQNSQARATVKCLRRMLHKLRGSFISSDCPLESGESLYIE